MLHDTDDCPLAARLAAATAALSGRGWGVVTRAGFTDGQRTDVAQVRRLACCFGTPSARDGDTEIWPVRPVSRDRRQTFSQRDGEALLHTDAAYRAAPEPLFALFCVRPARDGGRTRLLAAGAAFSGLDAETVSVLRRPVWRWVPPAVFGGRPDVARPVVSRSGEIRWRFDNLAIGAELRPVAARFRDHIENHPGVTEFMLPTDSVLICRNQTMLHGRTGFSDIGRLLLRVRLEQR
jgi:alpha-ketoglutarate-dependent taurine dioxygenase